MVLVVAVFDSAGLRMEVVFIVWILGCFDVSACCWFGLLVLVVCLSLAGDAIFVWGWYNIIWWVLGVCVGLGVVLFSAKLLPSVLVVF